MLSRRALFLGLGAIAATGGAGIAWRLWRANASHEPPAPPDVDADGRLLWRNWSGIQAAYPSERWAPRSVDELAQGIAQRGAPIRVVGSGHSFTPLVPTSGALLTLD